MSADSEGNDLSAVGVPITGFAAVQLPTDAGAAKQTFVASKDGAATPLVMPEGYQKVGLFKVDGGPQEGGDAGDAIEFFQQGHKLAGDDQPNVVINLAQFDALVRRLVTGKTADENGMIVVTGLTPDHVFPLFTAVKFKNGWSERKNGLARISAVEKDQMTRGEVTGRAVTFEWIFNEEIGGFYREWLVPPAKSAASARMGTQSELGVPVTFDYVESAKA